MAGAPLPAVLPCDRYGGRETPAPSSSLWPWVATAVACLGLLGVQLGSFGLDLERWDFLFLSGALTLITALWVARGQASAFETMVVRLVSRGQLKPPEATYTLACGLKKRERRWARWGGAGVALLLAGLFLLVTALRSESEEAVVLVGGPLAGALGGFLAGRVIGRMALYSVLPWSLERPKPGKREHVELEVTPGHPDGAAGLKPLGDFFLAQALLLAVPAIFLFIWTLLFFLPAFEDRYGDWRAIYVGLFLLAIAVEIAAFLIPLWRVHTLMKKAKRERGASADVYAREIATIKGDLLTELEPQGREELNDRLKEVTSAYYAIEKMATWPIDSSARRWLTLGNAALILSLASQAAGLFGGG